MLKNKVKSTCKRKTKQEGKSDKFQCRNAPIIYEIDTQAIRIMK
jgi:hypothetical protein